MVRPGDVLLVDWREPVSGGESNKSRPAVVVGSRVLSANATTLILVPVTTDSSVVLADFALNLTQTAGNGLRGDSFALAHLVTAATRSRVYGHIGAVTSEELGAVRALVHRALED